MSIHVSRFGAYGSELQQFADENGYIPEWDDDPETMDDYGRAEEYETWDEFLGDVMEAVDRAVLKIKNWRRSQ